LNTINFEDAGHKFTTNYAVLSVRKHGGAVSPELV